MAESSLLRTNRLTMPHGDVQRLLDAARLLDVSEILTAARGLGDRHYLVCLLLANTGARIGEVRRMELSDFDARTNAVRVHRQKKRKPSPEWLRVHPRLIPDVQRYAKRLGIESGPLFPGRKGKQPWATVRTLQGLYYESAIKAAIDIAAPAGQPGAKGRACHSLRHARATRLAETGADMAVIRRQLGHSKIDTSLTYISSARIKEKVKNLPGV